MWTRHWQEKRKKKREELADLAGWAPTPDLLFFSLGGGSQGPGRRRTELLVRGEI